MQVGILAGLSRSDRESEVRVANRRMEPRRAHSRDTERRFSIGGGERSTPNDSPSKITADKVQLSSHQLVGQAEITSASNAEPGPPEAAASEIDPALALISAFIFGSNWQTRQL